MLGKRGPCTTFQDNLQAKEIIVGDGVKPRRYILCYNPREAEISCGKGGMAIDQEKIDAEARFDGKWVLRTKMKLSAERVALKYKELWQVEQVFRDVKSMLDTRPVFHKRDETIRGHVFCNFLALVLR